jgi:hypothetical protein
MERTARRSYVGAHNSPLSQPAVLARFHRIGELNYPLINFFTGGAFECSDSKTRRDPCQYCCSFALWTWWLVNRAHDAVPYIRRERDTLSHRVDGREELRQLGYNVTEIGETQRILAHAITQRLTFSSSGAYEEMRQGSTKAVAQVRHRAEIARVLRYQFSLT